MAERHSPDGFGADLQPVLDMANVTLDASQPLAACQNFLDNVVATMLRS